MDKVILRSSPVIFNEEEHTYTLDGKMLHGITKMLRNQLFPDEYSDVPATVLQRAAERGTAVHKDTELYDMGFTPAVVSDELKSYIDICMANNMTVLESEYTVSDEVYFASNIDKVLFKEDGSVSLADIKTTYTPNIEYVQWQLSIYAYLFEMQNPDIHVSSLYLIWLRGKKHRFTQVERMPDETIRELLDCERNGRKFKNPLSEKTGKYPAEIVNAEKQLYNFETRLRALKSDKEKLMSGLLEQMRKHSITSYKGTYVHLIRKNASTRETVDTQRMKAECPDIYEKYKKTTETKESLTLKIIENG